MRSFHPICVCVLALSAAGCPGTLEDTSEYENYGERGVDEPDDDDEVDGAAPPIANAWDAGSRNNSWDGASNPPSDASVPPSNWADGAARPTWGDAEAGWPEAAARTPDAAIADASAAADAGPLCDFRGLMQARCGNASCHGGAAASTGLDLTSAGLADRVKGQRANGACGQYLLIDVAKPEQSALYLKVTNEACGVRMPVGGTLSNSEQACILQWIDRL
jgi:hypothetical protein